MAPDDARTGIETLATGGSQPASPEPASAPPPQIGRYYLLRRLGAGAMGVVYAAYDEQLERRVALKLLRARPGGAGESQRSRISREALALARLSHPNVVQVYEVGEHGNSVYLAMEHISGLTLRAWLAAAARRWQDVLAAYIDAGRGLAAAHAAGIVHRDFKPDNVLVGDDGRVRVLDFGVARSTREDLSEESDSEEAPPTGSLELSLTATGTLLGTPAYMPPEQFRSADVDARSDQFSFCVSLYEGLHGARPFPGATPQEVQRSILAGPRPPPRRSPVPGWLHAVVVRGLALDPEARHPSMAALLAALADDPARRRRRRLALAGGLLAAFAVGLGGYELARRRDVPCAAAAAELAGVWDDAVKQRVRAALRAAEPAFAEATWRSVEAALDAYAASWLRLRQGTCLERQAGVHSETALDRRAACLDDRRGGLAALTQVLARADAGVAARAAGAATGLPPLQACALAGQAPRVADDVPRTAEEAELRRSTRRRLDVAAAEEAAGHYIAARDAAASARASATRLGHRDLLAEATLRDASVRVELDDIGPARSALVDAYLLADGAGDDDIAAAAAIELTEVTGKTVPDPDAAALWERLARAKLERLGDPQPERVRLLRIVAAADIRRGRYAEAEGRARSALADLDPGDPDVALTRAELLKLLGTALVLQERLPDAEAALREALTIREQRLGPAHPDVADVLNNLGTLYQDYGEFAVAEQLLRRALQIYRLTVGPRSAHVGRALANLASVAIVQRDLVRGETYLRAALELTRERSDDSELLLLNNLAVVAQRRHRYVDAERFLREVLAEHERGGETHDLFAALANLGNVLAEAGRHDEAARVLQRAADVAARVAGPQSYDRALALFNLGSAHIRAERNRDAVAPLTAAAALLRSDTTHWRDDLAAVLTELAHAHFDLEEFAAAEAEAREALALRVALRGEDAPATQRSRSLLAAALLALGRVDEALSESTRAVEAAAPHAKDAAELGAMRFTHARALLAAGRRAEARAAAELATREMQADPASYRSALAALAAWRARNRL